MFSILICLLLTIKYTYAQEIVFDKKSGAFSVGNKQIAKLKSEKEKYLGKTYRLEDAEGKEVLSFEFQFWEDTIGSPMEFYYKANCSAIGKHVFRPSFTNSMNTFKEVGAYILDAQLIAANGTLIVENANKLFEGLAEDFGDYDAKHKRANDSLVQLINISSEIVERNRRKQLVANEYGKIGQDNTVIAQWELHSFKGRGFNASDEYVFFIKNNNGGLLCVSWISLSGAKTFTFKNGVRSKEMRTVINFAAGSPVSDVSNQIKYVEGLGMELFKAGLL